MNKWSEEILLFRRRRGMKQEEFANLMSVSRQTVSNWENGKVELPDTASYVKFEELKKKGK